MGVTRERDDSDEEVKGYGKVIESAAGGRDMIRKGTEKSAPITITNKSWSNHTAFLVSMCVCVQDYIHSPHLIRTV